MNCEYCEWLDKVLVEYEKKLPRKKNNTNNKYQRKRILEPIIIVHGLPDEYLNENVKTSLEFIKKIIIEKYNNLLEGKTAFYTVESMIFEIEKLSDLSKESWRETILVDDEGAIGCVAGLIKNHSLKFAKDIYNRKIDVLQIINNHDDDNLNDKIDNSYNIKSGCWSIIVRDLEENMSCGRTNWYPNISIDSKISLKASTIIYGCGIFLEDETCCSLSGNDEIIYLFSLAKKINKSIEEPHKYTPTKQTINEYTNKFNNLSCIYLGPCERPIINCHSNIFPWFYCCKKKIYSGIKKDEFKMESIDEAINKKL